MNLPTFIYKGTKKGIYKLKLDKKEADKKEIIEAKRQIMNFLNYGLFRF